MQRKINSIRTSYKHYKSICENPVKKDFYIEVCNRFMEFLKNKLVKEGKIVLPKKLGILYISGYKVKPKFKDGKPVNLAPDWKSTKKLWEEDTEAKKNKQLVYHDNINTDGVRYKTRWLLSKSTVINKRAYSFILARSLKREISKSIKEGSEYTIYEYGQRVTLY